MKGDKETDALYVGMRERYGQRKARANGYRYENYFRREQALVFELIKPDARVIVDLACGSGLMSSPLNSRCDSLLGLDFNAHACIAARDNGLKVMRGDAFNLPLASSSVSQVINCQFFNQQKPQAMPAFMRELARVLEPGGEAVLVWRNASALIHRVAHLLLTALDRIMQREVFPQYTHPLAVVAAIATEAGLELKHNELSCPPLNWRSTAVNSLSGRLIGASCVLVLSKPKEAG